jgi:hypothetical protein
MTSGSYAANVTVEGARGTGAVTVPVVAAATARLGMDRRLAWGLAALGTLFVAGALSVVGAAVLCGAALAGGATWWRAADARFARGLWHPLASTIARRPPFPERSSMASGGSRRLARVRASRDRQNSSGIATRRRISH